jgi:peptidyl-prolyl cis-trans isomerase SurA
MQQAEQKAQSLYNRLVNKHASFATLAKEDSDDDTTANNGGDMGWFQQNAWGSAIGQQIAQLKDGEVSKPFQTAEGWHLVKRLGERQTDVTEKAAREQARQAIGNRKAEQAYDDYLRQLRSSSYVKILVPALAKPDEGNAKASS